MSHGIGSHGTIDVKHTWNDHMHNSHAWNMHGHTGAINMHYIFTSGYLTKTCRIQSTTVKATHVHGALI